ncbi:MULTISPECIES: 2-C-methyl-D-erythritol 4-phosphate cytidylyltransferase [Sphingobacterium]|uniref:2-C-methyl-D-erythritol 4-phosphate cytidylyltransferase n=1 Tax=Sphingobacterium TaxID=28453 RepID=UPI001045424D|nr:MULTISPECIES: 2-C-methyl-D-erythritol 4-phosphate cytidylyltransferase [Sphingobacterium]MCW2260563.1 2-C-methyl-D-erythritol 4-phosphate cytidylyltransferase [Sphingobacterium kitahiroshimense]TCR08864.1 2-C-methyl-D-erythritol 4-phosphate cytidylyltransferase [Sphingobacterium sp. JUb78]
MIDQSFVLIVAAGKGSRMQSDLPKQYLLMNGKPVLMHTIEKFYTSTKQPHIIIAIDPAMEYFWKSLCQEYKFTIPHDITYGGETRFQTVKNGIAFIKKKQLNLQEIAIAVHDAARPLIAANTIDLAFEQVEVSKAVIVARSCTDSVRMTTADTNYAIDRNHIWLVQTPQIFEGGLLETAYEQDEEATFTDDASVVERLGIPIHIVIGDYKNIKITYPEDLEIAQIYSKV